MFKNQEACRHHGLTLETELEAGMETSFWRGDIQVG